MTLAHKVHKTNKCCDARVILKLTLEGATRLIHAGYLRRKL